MSETPTASGDGARKDGEKKEEIKPRGFDGFELDGRFYRFTLSTKIKDLQLIDHFAQMPPQHFFAIIEEGNPYEITRSPIFAAMIATSLRAANPAWSTQRIVAAVEDADLLELMQIALDEEERSEEDGPPASDSAGSTSESSSAESSSSPTPPEEARSETSSETPNSSTPPGSPTGSPESEAPSE